MLKQKKIHCELEQIPSMWKSIAVTLRHHGIDFKTPGGFLGFNLFKVLEIKNFSNGLFMG